MTGPEHFREAERDIDRANNESVADGFAQFFMTRAQVHATLALASAPAPAKAGTAIHLPRPQRYDGCDDTCTADCGHCKGAGKPKTEAAS